MESLLQLGLGSSLLSEVLRTVPPNLDRPSTALSAVTSSTMRNRADVPGFDLARGPGPGILVDAALGHLAHQGAEPGAESHAEDRHEEHHAEQQAPEHPPGGAAADGGAGRDVELALGPGGSQRWRPAG